MFVQGDGLAILWNGNFTKLDRLYILYNFDGEAVKNLWDF